MNNILFTGFVNTDVPKNAIKYVGETFDKINVMCTTGISELDKLPKNKISSMVMGHFGLLPSFHESIKSGDIDAINIPQGVFTQLIKSPQGMYKTKIGMNTFVEHNNGFLIKQEGKYNPYMEILKDRGEILYLLPSLKYTAVVLVDSYDPLTGFYKLGGTMPLDRKEALSNASEVILGCYNITSIDPEEIDGILTNVKHYTKEDKLDLSYKTKNIAIPESKIDYCERVKNLIKGEVINIGIGGLPEMVSSTLDHEKYTFTVESGCIGGTPLTGKAFGTALDPEEVLSHSEMFNKYYKGFIDTAILGVGEFTTDGKINVHNFKGKISGVGGFVDITSKAKRLIFCASDKKLVDNLEEITYDVSHKDDNQEVFILTETKTYPF